jgi:predicted secreted protein
MAKSMGSNDKQRKRIIVTAVLVGVIALMFYILTFVRHWS